MGSLVQTVTDDFSRGLMGGISQGLYEGSLTVYKMAFLQPKVKSLRCSLSV